MSLAKLENALPALTELRAQHSREIDWEWITEAFGTPFPEDYVQLAEAYGSLEIDDFMGIAVPEPSEEARFVAGRRQALYPIESLHEAGLSHGYVPYPQPSGLIPWGDTIDGDEFYWRSSPEGPNAWTIVVAGRNGDWVDFNGTLTEYLAGLVSGEVAPDGLPPDFRGRSPRVAIWE